MGVAEITDDGTSPALTPEVSSAAATEAAGMAAPSWVEDINFEQTIGTLTIISIYYELHWQMKVTGAVTGYAKWQISRDGGANWVDVTDNVAEAGVAYVNKTRIGVGVHIPTVVAGVNQLRLRVAAWQSAAGSVETRIRSDSYLRVTYRKS